MIWKIRDRMKKFKLRLNKKIKMRPKTKEIDECLEKISGFKRNGFQCSFCGSDKVNVSDFDGRESVIEFTISGLCQECQNQVFGERENGTS